MLPLHPDDKLHVFIAGDLNDFLTKVLRENFALLNYVTNATSGKLFWTISTLMKDCALSIQALRMLDFPSGTRTITAFFALSLSAETRRQALVWDFRESNVVSI